MSDALMRLADFMVEDILALSDEEMLAEVREDGEDPEKIAAAMRRTYDWSLHCGKCQASRLAYLYEWRNMIYANRFIGLTGIEIWDGWH